MTGWKARSGQRGGRHREEGASLVLAMVIVTAVSLVAASLLQYAGGGLRVNGRALDAVQDRYNVGASLDTAINDVRNSDYFNNSVAGQVCLNNGQRTYSDLRVSGQPVTVTCSPDPDSGGAAGLVPVNNSNKPSVALLTLGAGGEPGLDKSGNSVLRIKGSVYSNSTAGTSSGTDCPATPQPPAAGANCNEIYVQGASLTAEGSCTGRIVATGTPGLSCNTGTHVTAGDDPGNTYPAGYAQPSAGLTPASLPSCAGPSPVTFSPGYYDDAVGLTNLTTGSGSCRGKTFWFKPGTYYFDFHNSEMPTSGSPVVPNGPDVWTFDDVDAFLVAGTKQGWTTQATIMPGSCISPLTSTSSQGVTFVFGGDSQFYMKRGNAEICGTWASDKPPIALYGAKTTTGVPQSATLYPSSVTGTSGSPDFTGLSPVSALASKTDSGAGPVAAAVEKNKTAVLAVTGLSGLGGPIAARAVLDSATLTVRHGEKGATAGTSLTVGITANRPGGRSTTKTLSPTVGSSSITYKEETLDLTSVLSQEMYAYGLSSATAPVLANVSLNTDSTSGQSVTEQVDYVQLTLTWKPLALRAQSGCITTVGGCPVIGTNAQSGKQLYIEGTAYLPKARVDITLNNVSGQVFRSGLVARSASLSISASSSYAGPVIELPDNAFAPAPLDMFFAAYVCPSGSSCASPPPSVGWQLVGRAKARYTDTSFTPVPGDRAVSVAAWQVAR
jgi:hypothetical protein